MRRRIIRAAVLIAAAGLLLGAEVQQAEAPESAAAHHRPGGKQLRNGCHRLYTVRRVHGYARARYRTRTAPLTRGQKRYLRRMTRCMFSAKKAARARRLQRRLRRGFRFRLAEARLAPYVCHWSQTSGRSAIPCYIVECESHGLWWAHNPSGARGRYQLLGHGEPWPVLTGSVAETRRRILTHHRIARSLPLSTAWEACD